MPAQRRRVRRTPEQAREEILAVARTRLLEHGIEGLRVADVARDLRMSHATLLHHFGSSEGMRTALITRMGADVLTELLATMDDAQTSEAQRARWLSTTFATLAEARHGQLFAWLALQPGQAGAAAADQIATPTANLFGELLARMQKVMPLAQAQFLVTLVVTSAIGMGVSRGWLGAMGLPAEDADVARFVLQLSALLPAAVPGTLGAAR